MQQSVNQEAVSLSVLNSYGTRRSIIMFPRAQELLFRLTLHAKSTCFENTLFPLVFCVTARYAVTSIVPKKVPRKERRNSSNFLDLMFSRR